MCKVCDDLRAKVTAALRAGDTERANVQQAILDGHRANTCPGSRWAAALWREEKQPTGQPGLFEKRRRGA